MRNETSHKASLIQHGMKRFFAGSYHGTSVDAVLDEAKVPKGSFYHHFGSKEAFAMAVVHEYHVQSAARLAKWAGAPDMSAAERLHAYMEEMAHRLDRRGNRHGCLIGKFSLELAPSSTPFSTLLSTMLSTWKASVQAILAEGQAEGSVRRDLDAADLATIVLSTIQGAVLLCLAHRSSEPMYVAAATVTKLISE